MTRVLLVDDDEELCAMLAEYLAIEGFDTECVHEGPQGVERALSEDHDVMVLDVMLPGMPGFDILREVRRHSALPVLMLTARGGDVDRIVGLELGADDYLPKPANPRELVARLRAILRRVQGESPGHKAVEVLRVDHLEIRCGAREAYLHDQLLELTSTEYGLLEVLVRAAGHLVTKDTLSREVLGRPLARYDRSIDMHMSNLRRKMGGDGDHSAIRTVRGQGYQYVVD